MRKIISPRIALFTLIVIAISAAVSMPAFAQIRISVSFGPPPLPVYEQPICPGDGYLWTPGFWAWDADFDDYYWVPGTWVLAPEVGFFWTPPYWGWADGVYVFYGGYWGPEIGFYGGIDYGFGYFGEGFVGGRWEGGHFFYNRAILNVNVEVIHNVYVENVSHTVINRVSFNGGEGGITARPTPREEAAARQRHVGPVSAQTEHINAARGNPELRASANHGKPAVAATARPGDFKSGAMTARQAGGEYKPHPSRTGAAAPGRETGGGGTRASHAKDLAPIERSNPNTGNPKSDKKYQQQQDKMIAKQNQERDKLQQQQEKEHAKMAKQNADEARKQQVEQRHQQQTEQMQQRHTEQRQQLQQKYPPPPGQGGGKK
jgi:WXXGXW repeat (2 copies)